MDKPVTILIPFRNEEKYLPKCLSAVFGQDYKNFEIILVDGMSNDRSREIIADFTIKYPNLSVYDNKKINAAAGLNIGIEKSHGEIVIILGAHSEISPDFVSKNAYYLERTGADVVGGALKTIGKGYFGECVALVLSSPFGTGSKFRYTNSAQFVDTVAFGAYRRKILNKVGLFDEKIPRAEDLEYNHRIITAGGKIYLHPDIRAVYYCRNDLFGFVKQGFANGYDVIRSFFNNVNSVSLRHLIPVSFVFSLFVLAVLFPFSRIARLLFIYELGAYFIITIFFSIQISLRNGLKYLPILPVTILLLHLSYGMGSLFGISSLSWLKK